MEIEWRAVRALRVGPATRLSQHVLEVDVEALRAAAMRAAPALARVAVHLVHPGESTRITVSDDGPGIPPAVLETLFEPFVTTRVGRQEASLVGGAGLGLTVTKHLIERAGGSIVATSSDQGATFEIELPTARPMRAKAG